MFGYIQPLKPELKVRELEVFKAYYCSLCKVIGKRYGKKAQFLIQYDCAFLGMLLDAQAEEKPEFYQGRCSYHPLKKKMLVRSNPALEYAADINLLLAYYKLRDDVADDGDLKSKLLLPLFFRAGKKAAKRLPEEAGTVRENIEALSRLEKARCADLDEMARPTAQMLANVFRGGTHIDPMAEIGYNLGRWIYLIDAYDDIPKDREDGAYNLFLEKYGPACLSSEECREEAAFSLQFSLAKAAEAFEKLDIKRNRGILENILYAGVLRKTEDVLAKKELQE